MSSPIMAKFELPYRRHFSKVFSDDQLSRTVTYSYSDVVDGEMVWTPLTLKAICNQDRLFSSDLPESVKMQAGERVYILWTYRLPAITVDHFTANDRITDGGKEFVVIEIDKSPRSIVKAKVIGSD